MHTLPGHLAPVRCVAISPDGTLLASASGNYGQSGEIKVWDMATGQERSCLRGHKDLVSCVAFSPDGRRLASANGGVRTPGEIKVWDAADGRELFGLPAHATPVRGLAFSPDGRQLASAAGGFDPRGSFLPGEVKIWDAADGRQLLCIRWERSHGLAHGLHVSGLQPGRGGAAAAARLRGWSYGPGLRPRHGKRTFHAWASTRIWSLAWRTALTADVSLQVASMGP